jgi:hypothetical protein
MEKDRTITALIEDCTFYFEQNCYTKDRVERYRSMWRNGICRYMKDNGIKNYDRPIGERFIRDNVDVIPETDRERPWERNGPLLEWLKGLGK